MKLDLGPVRSAYVAPSFGADEKAPLDSRLEQRLKRPMLIGAGVIGAFILGVGAWAALTVIPIGVTAPAEIRLESNRKTLRAKDSGTVKQILVREGQRVRGGQPLLIFNDVEARAGYDVLQNQYDALQAQNARFSAEATGRTALTLPPDLALRMADPRVAAMWKDQEFLFATRKSLFESQSAVLQQRIEQLETQVTGLQAQLDSIDEQVLLTNEELDGYRRLNEQGYAPKNLVLRYERNLSELRGRRGQLTSDVARLRQQMGETRIQLVTLKNQRASEAAEGLRDSQSRIADVLPRLTATRQTLNATVLRAPVDGYVFNLTQFTIGGVVGSGELIMDVVPALTPLTVTAMIKPEEVDQVHMGQTARVRLTGLNQRFSEELLARVSVIAADRVTNEKTGVSFYRVDLQIPPSELRKIERGVQLTPGMPAMATIVSGERTVLQFLMSPITDTLRDAFREE